MEIDKEKHPHLVKKLKILREKTKKILLDKLTQEESSFYLKNNVLIENPIYWGMLSGKVPEPKNRKFKRIYGPGGIQQYQKIKISLEQQKNRTKIKKDLEKKFTKYYQECVCKERETILSPPEKGIQKHFENGAIVCLNAIQPPAARLHQIKYKFDKKEGAEKINLETSSTSINPKVFKTRKSISTSICIGGSPASTYGNRGYIIKGGEIKLAHHSDAGSHINSQEQENYLPFEDYSNSTYISPLQILGTQAGIYTSQYNETVLIGNIEAGGIFCRTRKGKPLVSPEQRERILKTAKQNKREILTKEDTQRLEPKQGIKISHYNKEDTYISYAKGKAIYSIRLSIRRKSDSFSKIFRSTTSTGDGHITKQELQMIRSDNKDILQKEGITYKTLQERNEASFFELTENDNVLNFHFEDSGRHALFTLDKEKRVAYTSTGETYHDPYTQRKRTKEEGQILKIISGDILSNEKYEIVENAINHFLQETQKRNQQKEKKRLR